MKLCKCYMTISVVVFNKGQEELQLRSAYPDMQYPYKEGGIE